jgi:hypothetical protein
VIEAGGPDLYDELADAEAKAMAAKNAFVNAVRPIAEESGSDAHEIADLALWEADHPNEAAKLRKLVGETNARHREAFARATRAHKQLSAAIARGGATKEQIGLLGKLRAVIGEQHE